MAALPKVIELDVKVNTNLEEYSNYLKDFLLLHEKIKAIIEQINNFEFEAELQSKNQEQ